MPNWCDNSITISGPTEQIKTLWENAHTEETNEDGTVIKGFGLLQAMRPMPAELEGTSSPGDSPNWYDWRVTNWSTKWDIDDEGLEFHDHGNGTAEISGWFQSAWAPPIEAYNFFVAENPDCSLSASYWEPGMDFAGFYEDGDDEFMEDLGHYARQVLKGTDIEDTPALFQRVDEEWNIVEQAQEWYQDEEEA